MVESCDLRLTHHSIGLDRSLPAHLPPPSIKQSQNSPRGGDVRFVVISQLLAVTICATGGPLSPSHA